LGRTGIRGFPRGLVRRAVLPSGWFRCARKLPVCLGTGARGLVQSQLADSLTSLPS
jgi:hypothetical protein